MTDDQILEVVQAHKEGKQIQCVAKWAADQELNWRDIDNPEWQFGTSDYRVKPEPRKPREWWVHDYEIRNIAKSGRGAGCDKCIHVREVIDE